MCGIGNSTSKLDCDWDMIKQIVVSGDRREIEQLLVDYPGIISAKNKHEFTTLYFVEDSSTAEFLISRGADVNACIHGMTLLYILANNSGKCALIITEEAIKNRMKWLEIATILIQNGADVNVRDNSNRTPLFQCYTE